MLDEQIHVGPSDAHRYRTASEFAYAQLRGRIVRCELKPGERIDQDAEAARLNVSRMPIREALRRLSSDGLVEILPHRGAMVRPMNLADLEDLYVLRISLEGLAGRLGCEQLSEQSLSVMEGLMPIMGDIVDNGNPDQWLDADWQFHSSLYESTGHTRLVRFIHMLREEATRYRRLGFLIPDELRLSLRGHEDILAACRARDSEEVERLIVASLEQSRDKIREIVRVEFEQTDEP